MATLDPLDHVEPMPSVRTVAHLVYALHACAIVIGIAGMAGCACVHSGPCIVPEPDAPHEAWSCSAPDGLFLSSPCLPGSVALG
jgi:hypothetical protein